MSDKSFLDIDKEIHQLQKEKYKLNTTNLLMKGSTFVGVTMYGQRRIGKSVLAMLSLYEIYKDWDIVLSRMFYNLKDLTKFLKQCAEEDYKCPAIIFDDAGVGGGRQMYNVNRVLVHYMGSVFDVIGTTLKGMVLTTPDSENLIKAIRRADFYKIKVTQGRQRYDRVATIYRPMHTPYEQFRLQKVAIDRFDTRLPTEVYEKYYKMRKQYTKEALDRLEEIIHATEQEGEHIDYDENETDKLDYQKQYHRDYRKGKKRIRKSDWGNGYA